MTKTFCDRCGREGPREESLSSEQVELSPDRVASFTEEKAGESDFSLSITAEIFAEGHGWQPADLCPLCIYAVMTAAIKEWSGKNPLFIAPLDSKE